MLRPERSANHAPARESVGKRHSAIGLIGQSSSQAARWLPSGAPCFDAVMTGIDCQIPADLGLAENSARRGLVRHFLSLNALILQFPGVTSRLFMSRDPA
jgi:hypothetical protein